MQFTFAAPPPHKPKPVTPSANASIDGVNTMLTPNPVIAGQPLSYTVKVSVQGPLDANNLEVVLVMAGDQQFSGFDPSGSGWTLSRKDNQIHLAIGSVKVGYKAQATISTIAPTNIDRPILQQSIFLNWVDEHYYNKEFQIAATLSNPSATANPLPIAPVISTPTNGLPISGPFAAQSAPQTNNYSSGDVWYFPITQHYSGFGFLAYWRTHGSVLNLGYPISEEFQEKGMTVQYFERGVLEYHPENPTEYSVLLRALGREAGEAEPAIDGTNTPDDQAQYYPETGHWISGAFVKAWTNGGGVMQFGYPIAEAYQDGSKLIQWFERARFEVDTSKPNQLVMLGLVGRESSVSKGYLTY
ncbi:MAG: hypothetical protein HXX08_05055 [Chloroflexi bacterium]|uniref:Uncharacterized protein n=1 Tax=Candidatus Chlorohelix allophototropha TaxID=3003348 RepID=A0A8T7M124_9CHLR|nr:hypothetical protein [Chloroflexota bacterium]WJW67108.1 hypothetical protein OZ401_000359 [Chloroflexota bacterium L227-S17]